MIGAGIAGVSCARVLASAGLEVELVDRGRKVGGRMASRRLEGRPTDLGAAFFTASDPRFAAVVHDWAARGLARPWTDTLTVLDAGDRPHATSGVMRWGTPGGIRSLVEDLASGLTVTPREVRVVSSRDDGRLQVHHRPASAVVLAMPDPQARVLLGAGLQACAAHLDRAFDPVLALAAWWPERTWDGIAGPRARFEGAFVNGDPEITWIADDGRRRGDDAPVLVAHSTPEFAGRHLADPQSAAPAMIAALRRLLQVPVDPDGHFLQRWSVAKPTGVRAAPYWLGPQNLGFCGDGWGPVSRVEGAYLSGLALGAALVERLR